MPEETDNRGALQDGSNRKMEATPGQCGGTARGDAFLRPLAGRPAIGRALRLCVFGCAPDTGNLGVSALCFSLLSGLHHEAANSEVTVFDNDRGLRWGATWMGDHALSFSLVGGRYSRRLHEASSLWNIRMCARRGGMWNAGAQAVLNSDALLDVSGGDSFTDLYGPKRFRSVTFAKRMGLELGIPLILLPQTYGPFHGARTRRIAIEVVRHAEAAWARDNRSYEALQELLGDALDPERHHCGVDLAFGLASKKPRTLLPRELEEWLNPAREHPTIGINVSGLLYNDPRGARRRYGLKVDYRVVIDDLIRRFLDETGARILLIPHVRHAGAGAIDTDHTACRVVRDQFQRTADGRVAVLEAEVDQSEMKHVISQLDWFCGTRMHSTIAALSSAVPVAAIAYSLKTLGVFESCGQGKQVIDPRSMGLDEVCTRIWQSWVERERVREDLQRYLPGVFEKCRHQMRAIVAACEEAAARRL